MNAKSAQREELPLPTAATQILEECRMVLPGIQALFGFQLIAVFNSGFRETLSYGEQALHLAAIVLVVLAIALVMAPAALHRQTDPHAVTGRFIRISSMLLLLGMVPLALSICLEVYLIAHLILGGVWAGVVLAGLMLAVLMGFWVGLPRWERRRSGS